MKQYEFTKDGIDNFYDNICEEIIEKSSDIMQEIWNTHDKITDEQNARFEQIYNSIAINVTIGSHTIIIPNNADNIEVIFRAIEECREQSI